ncbi:MAG: TonB family protein [Bryobacteraceae bacterium]
MGEELDLFPQWSSPEAARRAWWSRLASAGIHLLAAALLFFTPLGRGPVHDVQRVLGQFKEPIVLVAPPRELTQTAPNRGRVGKEFDLGSLLPRPKVFAPPSVPVGAPPAGRPVPLPLPEPPKIEIAQGEVPPLGQSPTGLPLPPPQIPSPEKPKLALESLGTPRAAPSLKPPSSSIAEMGRELARGRGGGLVVEDFSPAPGGLEGGLPIEPSPGRTGSSLELLSDPKGVDFRPYLIRILASVKRNWLAVIPESARLGRRGRVAIQFVIAKDGSVPRLVISSASGTEALDRAAVAGISASNPFPPLPAEFQGADIRLQFVFLYNVQPSLR